MKSFFIKYRDLIGEIVLLFGSLCFCGRLFYVAFIEFADIAAGPFTNDIEFGMAVASFFFSFLWLCCSIGKVVGMLFNLKKSPASEDTAE